MSVKALSANSRLVIEEACDIAQQADQSWTTAHLLLAFFVVPNSAERLLTDHGINEETLLAQLDATESEKLGLSEVVEHRAAELADTTDSDAIFCLHLLAALVEFNDGIAYRLLVRTQVDVDALRKLALDYTSEGAPQHWHAQDGERATVRETSALASLDPETPAEDRASDSGHRDLGEVTVQTPAVGRRARTESAQCNARAFSQAQSASERRSRSPGRRASDKPGMHGRRQDRRESDSAADAHECGPWSLDPEAFPWLSKLGRNLNEIAARGDFDPVIGRDNEIEQSVDILNKRRSNNPCLVGEPGVGKTAIVEGVVQKLVSESEVSSSDAPIIIQIDVGAILAGTHLRGSLAERLRGLQDEVKQASGRVVVFVDEIHTLIGAGGGDGAHDAANELKAALARGEFPCIGATTTDEYREYVESDAALERRFTAVHVAEPSISDTERIVRAVAPRYAEHHDVAYEDTALTAAVRLGRRYLHERKDPDRALGILDLAGAVARRSNKIVGRRAVAEVIARAAQIPMDQLMVDDPERFLQMEAWLGQRLIGQSHVLSTISETIRRNLAGFTTRQPVGSFLFLGPTGVGKTQAVKALAEFLFGHEDALVRFDMSEFLESHSVSRLIGSPPGYVGHQDGGQLTDRIRRRPYQVVLFDEIEKSHRDVWNVLLQILDEGRLTDARGRMIDFSNTLVVMTSNLGAESFAVDGRRIGFGDGLPIDHEAMAERALKKARAKFPPELWNRIEDRLVFHPLSREEIHRVAQLQIAGRSRFLEHERGITFSATDAAIDLLLEQGAYDVQMGARPMRQAIAREFESLLAHHILTAQVCEGDAVVIDVIAGELVVQTAAEQPVSDRVMAARPDCDLDTISDELAPL